MANDRTTRREANGDTPGLSRTPLWLGGAGALLAVVCYGMRAPADADGAAANIPGEGIGAAAATTGAPAARPVVQSGRYVLVQAEWGLPHGGTASGDRAHGGDDGAAAAALEPGVAPMPRPSAPGEQEWDNLDVAWAAEPPAQAWQQRLAPREQAAAGAEDAEAAAPEASGGERAVRRGKAEPGAR